MRTMKSLLGGIRGLATTSLASALRALGRYRSFGDVHTSAAVLLPTLLIAPFSLLVRNLPMSDDMYELCFSVTLATCCAGIGIGALMLSIMVPIAVISLCFPKDVRVSNG